MADTREAVARWLRAFHNDEPEDVWEQVAEGPREYWRGKADELLAVADGTR